MQVYPLYLLRDPSTLFCFSEKKSGAFRVDLWLYNFGLKARPTRSECFFFSEFFAERQPDDFPIFSGPVVISASRFHVF